MTPEVRIFVRSARFADGSNSDAFTDINCEFNSAPSSGASYALSASVKVLCSQCAYEVPCNQSISGSYTEEISWDAYCVVVVSYCSIPSPNEYRTFW